MGIQVLHLTTGPTNTVAASACPGGLSWNAADGTVAALAWGFMR
jgi:hypothetical protein